MFFDRPDAGERALLVHCDFFSAPNHSAAAFSRESAEDPAVDSPSIDAAETDAFPVDTTDSSNNTDGANNIDSVTDSTAEGESNIYNPDQYEPCVNEFIDLARSAGVDPIELVTAKRKKATPKFFIGSGKVAEIKALVEQNKIDVVMFNHALSPSQERNLEQELCCKVLDRTGLILDIFAQRARSHAGKLQVELAQLRHISTRLVRGWTHLERQKGGIGLRGPGESQLETDRRLLRERIKWISGRLDKVNSQRQQGRRARKRAELPTIALVGYTNAGKSTLFNKVSQATVYAADQLFATLDPTLRSVKLPQIGKIILADTVGFVSDLPHQLIAAFKATLEEAAEADLLLHVIDASAEDVNENIRAVDEVLAEIGAGELPVLHVMNKIDCLPTVQPHTDKAGADNEDMPYRVWLSAQSGAGIDGLVAALAELLGGAFWRGTLSLPAYEAKLRAQLYSVGAVTNESVSEQGEYQLDLCFPRDDLTRLMASANVLLPE